jgi:RNA polymerase sigma-70 factor, ECF subfamily
MHLAAMRHDASIHDLENHLIERARAGDADAYGDLVLRYRTNALRVATVVLGTAEGADDIVSDATERAWRALGRFEPGRRFRPWLLRIVANTARNDRRSKGRRANLVARASRASARDTVVSAEDATVTAFERRQVLDALNMLDTGDRLVIGLRYFEQLSEREMAEVLECAAGTVKSRLARAKARLREEMTRDD